MYNTVCYTFFNPFFNLKYSWSIVDVQHCMLQVYNIVVYNFKSYVPFMGIPDGTLGKEAPANAVQET